MASSSVSQESLDHDDYELSARRSRVRTIRGRSMPHKAESVETTDDKDLDNDMDFDFKENADGLGHCLTVGPCGHGHGESESPTRLAGRIKEKRGRPNHLHSHHVYRGKAAKDKRKLREKRRSTGVVHLASTESTGDSLDEEDKDVETRKNTSYNEIIDADNPQTPEEERKLYAGRSGRNKSPSDLDADLEDNQDYDSTVSQSETNLTTIGQSPQPTVTGHAKYSLRSSPKLSRSVPTTVHHHSHGRGYSHSTTHGHGHRVDDSISRPLSHPSRFREHGQSFQGAVHQAASAGLQSRTPGRGHTDGRCLGLASFRERAASNSGGSSTESNCLTRKGSQESMESRLLAKNVELEKQLEQEREEKRKLQELLDKRDNQIHQLEQEIAQLNKDLREADIEYERLDEDNRALLRAMVKLTAHSE